MKMLRIVLLKRVMILFVDGTADGVITFKQTKGNEARLIIILLGLSQGS
jgi:hypothetical protein